MVTAENRLLKQLSVSLDPATLEQTIIACQEILNARISLKQTHRINLDARLEINSPTVKDGRVVVDRPAESLIYHVHGVRQGRFCVQMPERHHREYPLVSINGQGLFSGSIVKEVIKIYDENRKLFDFLHSLNPLCSLDQDCYLEGSHQHRVYNLILKRPETTEEGFRGSFTSNDLPYPDMEDSMEYQVVPIVSFDPAENSYMYLKVKPRRLEEVRKAIKAFLQA